ncbi:CRISPR-associated protein Csx18 [Synechocystis salina]|uniref:CRISPR-associated protein Csx18 n=1 Tax=Synechocystis salina TaxID=945780 RepID=UPI001D1531FF|nr:CRISPR-associated protein Csx18 [Synechocystis salina]
MYSPSRLLFARNLVLAIANGLITLVILLIAPLGLAAVIINTLLVACSTFFLSIFGDAAVRWLLQGTNPHGLSATANRNADIEPQTSHQPTQRPDRW